MVVILLFHGLTTLGVVNGSRGACVTQARTIILALRNLESRSESFRDWTVSKGQRLNLSTQLAARGPATSTPPESLLHDTQSGFISNKRF